MFTIEEGTFNDYQIIAQFKYQLYTAMAEIVPTIHRAPPSQSTLFSERDFQEELSTKMQAYFIARTSSTKEPTGFISTGRRSAPKSPIFTHSPFANIDEIYVVPQHRNGGVGRALVRAACLWAESHELQTVKTGVYATNEEGNQFWEKMGFKPYKTLLERSPG